MTTCRTIVKLPFRIKDELVALNELRCTGHVRQMSTLTWQYAELAQLCVRALYEAWRGVVETYRAPAKLWEDTVSADDGKRHLLQTVSLCGRKVRSSNTYICYVVLATISNLNRKVVATI